MTAARPKVETVSLVQLTPDPGNARVHGSDNLAAIKASLQRFGQVRPLLTTGSGTVLAGNGTRAVRSRNPVNGGRSRRVLHPTNGADRGVEFRHLLGHVALIGCDADDAPVVVPDEEVVTSRPVGTFRAIRCKPHIHDRARAPLQVARPCFQDPSGPNLVRGGRLPAHRGRLPAPSCRRFPGLQRPARSCWARCHCLTSGTR